MLLLYRRALRQLVQAEQFQKRAARQSPSQVLMLQVKAFQPFPILALSYQDLPVAPAKRLCPVYRRVAQEVAGFLDRVPGRGQGRRASGRPAPSDEAKRLCPVYRRVAQEVAGFLDRVPGRG